MNVSLNQVSLSGDQANYDIFQAKRNVVLALSQCTLVEKTAYDLGHLVHLKTGDMNVIGSPWHMIYKYSE